jgi:ubiquinone/menaquinone biosynthesis C-methylase UbiE
MMCQESGRLLDIGAGLRISKEYGNRAEASHFWIADLIKERKTDYVVLDYVDTYHPHIVGDIQHLPLPDNSEGNIACLAILEHVENPFLAFSELHRVLRPGGQCLLYVPFLYYYHAEKTYYKDYWRFTKDSLASLCAPFSRFEIQNVRGPLETLVRLSPLGRVSLMTSIGFVLDKAFGKLSSPQTSGYYVWLVK